MRFFSRSFTAVAAAVAIAATLAATPANASRMCYNMSEFEAEQGLRIHSELMVIGLTCAKMPYGANLYSKYQMFTSKNQNLISVYENTLIEHYRREGASNPEAQFHTLRTGLANHISQLAIGNVVGFCDSFSPRIDAALGMDQNKLRHWAQQVWRNAPTSRPMCDR